jgi:Acetyltransferase (GNAT) domain
MRTTDSTSVIDSRSELTFEFTRDAGLLSQYYHVRQCVFIGEWGIKEFCGGKDEYDEISDILIARTGKLCVGGNRLTYSCPDHPLELPMEHDDLQLRKLLPELALDNKIYAECTRLALLPEYRTKAISRMLRTHSIMRNPHKQVSYCFWVAPLPLARSYRQSCLALGFPCEIRLDIEIPDKSDYHGINMCLGIMDFTSALIPAKARRAM